MLPMTLCALTFHLCGCSRNALRAINTGWVFQLNGDVTGNVCRADIYLPKTMCFAFEPFSMLPRARELMKSHGITCCEQLSCFPSASSTAAMTAVSVEQPLRSLFNIQKWFILLPPPIMPKAGFLCIRPCATTSRDGVILPWTTLASKATYAIHMQQVNVVSILYYFLVSKGVFCSYRCCPAFTSQVLPRYFSIWCLL